MKISPRSAGTQGVDIQFARNRKSEVGVIIAERERETLGIYDLENTIDVRFEIDRFRGIDLCDGVGAFSGAKDAPISIGSNRKAAETSTNETPLSVSRKRKVNGRCSPAKSRAHSMVTFSPSLEMLPEASCSISLSGSTPAKPPPASEIRSESANLPVNSLYCT